MAGTLDETTDWLVTEDGDFQPHMPIVAGTRALIQRLAMRWTTPRGRIPFMGWEDFGNDLRRFLLGKADPSEIVFEAKSEAEKDEQVAAIVVTPDTDAFSIASPVLRLDCRVFTDEGAVFDFTMTISEAGTELVELIQSA